MLDFIQEVSRARALCGRASERYVLTPAAVK
jgi:hypothetical protein